MLGRVGINIFFTISFRCQNWYRYTIFLHFGPKLRFIIHFGPKIRFSSKNTFFYIQFGPKILCFLFFLTLKYKICVNLYVLKNEFSLIRQKMRMFAIDPNCNNRPLLATSCELYIHDVAKVSIFYNGGLMGNFMSFVGSNWNFVSE